VGRLLLDSLILVLGFGTFFWFFVISPAAAASEEEFARFVLTQVYIGSTASADDNRRAAHERDQLPDAQVDARAPDGQLRAHVPGRHPSGRTAVVAENYFPGNISDVLYLASTQGSRPRRRSRSATSRAPSGSAPRETAR
jgi:hypothetical protein